MLRLSEKPEGNLVSPEKDPSHPLWFDHYQKGYIDIVRFCEYYSIPLDCIVARSHRTGHADWAHPKGTFGVTPRWWKHTTQGGRVQWERTHLDGGLHEVIWELLPLKNWGRFTVSMIGLKQRLDYLSFGVYVGEDQATECGIDFKSVRDHNIQKFNSWRYPNVGRIPKASGQWGKLLDAYKHLDYIYIDVHPTMSYGTLREVRVEEYGKVRCMVCSLLQPLTHMGRERMSLHTPNAGGIFTVATGCCSVLPSWAKKGLPQHEPDPRRAF